MRSGKHCMPLTCYVYCLVYIAWFYHSYMYDLSSVVHLNVCTVLHVKPEDKTRTPQ